MDLPDHAAGATAITRPPSAPVVPVAPIERFAASALHADGEAMRSTMAFMQQLAGLVKDPVLGPMPVS